MLKISLLATVLVLLHHTRCGDAETPHSPAVQKGNREGVHPDTVVPVHPVHPGSQVQPKPIAAPPPPHLYNSKDQANDPKTLPAAATKTHVVVETPTDAAHVAPHPPPPPHVDPQPQAPPHVVHQEPHVSPHAHQPDQHGTPQEPAQPNVVHPTPHVDPKTQAHAAEPHNTPIKGVPQFTKGDSLSFSSSSSSGPGKRQCSFTVSNPNTFHASTDGFGYPKFMVEGAAENNALAKQYFKKLQEAKNAGSGQFPVVSGAGRPDPVPAFGGGRHIPAFPGVGGQNQQNGDHDLDIDAMFNKIGKHATDERVGVFPHAPPTFPDHAIIPGRRFGPRSQLRTSFQRPNPFEFGGLNFRKKRQAIDNSLTLGGSFKNQLSPVCPSKSDFIRSFKKYNSACYLYKPQLQGRKVVTCTQKKCGHCGGSGRCVAEKESALVWAYCQGGPHARTLELEYIEYPAYCVCKTIQC